MSKITMETDLVRQQASLIDRQATEICEKLEALRRSSSRLSMDWTGSSNADQFHQDLRSWIQQVETQAEQLASLGWRLNREVDEWVEADTKFTKENGFWDNFVAEIKDISIDDVVRLGSTGIILSKLGTGAEYAGEVIFKGSHALKDAAGLFPNLTHIRADHIPGSLLKSSIGKITPLEIGLAGIEFVDRSVQDWGKYDSGSEKAVAIGLDAAFVAVKTVGIHYAAFAAASLVTGAIVAAGAPALLVAGAGIAVWAGVSYFGGAALDAGFATFKDSLVEGGGKLIDQAGQAIAGAATSVANAASQAAHQIDNAFAGFTNSLSRLFAGT